MLDIVPAFTEYIQKQELKAFLFNGRSYNKGGTGEGEKAVEKQNPLRRIEHFVIPGITTTSIFARRSRVAGAYTNCNSQYHI
jgi:hypothetical protein